MQKLTGGLGMQQAQAARGSRAAPLPATTTGLLPQRRRSETPLVCLARRSRTDLATPDSTTSPAASGGSEATPLPPPHQQHAQPPRPDTQHQGRAEVLDTMQHNSLRTPRKQAPQRHQAAQQSGSRQPADSPASPHVNSSQTDGSKSSSGGVASTPSAHLNAGSSKQAPPSKSTGRSAPSAASEPPQQQQPQPPDTQLIFRLERRGEGWGEEILPHLVVEQRPLAAKKKRAYSRPDPWKEGSLECYLVECGVQPEDVDRVVTQAVAWRVTPAGRSLIDRRRRSRVERNVRLVVEHLELECGVPFGPRGIAAILARCPEIMLCKPTTNDRWDRRAVELSAFLLRNGHCNVPEDWEENPELGLWVKRQRIARAAGQLSEERLGILQSMGFAFGEVAQLTEEWEHRFDQLVDWMLWHNENQQRFSWLGVDWGARGGITARELALWSTLQREYRARGLLPGEALSRFEAIGVQWDTPDGTPAERQWMAWFGRLLYLIERHNPRLQPSRQPTMRPKMGRPRGSRSAPDSSSNSGSGSDGGGGVEDSEQAQSEAEEVSADASYSPDASDDEEEPPSAAVRRGSAAVAAARQRLQAEMSARRAALAAADLRSEPGLCFWLARQRRRWRMQELPAEMALMLQLAGVQLDPYTPMEWQAMAHTAAAVLQGSRIKLDLHTQQQLHSQRQAAAAAAAALAAARGSGMTAAAAAPAVAAVAAATTAAAAAASVPRPAGIAESAAGTPPSSNDNEEGPAVDLGEARHPPLLPPQLLQPAGSTRLRVARWVETQQALFTEGKLSPAQSRYMAFLGITWVLSEEVTHMSEKQWHQWCARLAAAPRPLPRHSELWEWLQHQRGLHALGWLPQRRLLALDALQVQLDGFDRCAEDEEWDLRLSDLLAYRAEHGHFQQLLVAVAAPEGRQEGDEQRQRGVPLAAWLTEQHRLLAAGRLPAQKATQLAAIGATPLPPRAAPAQQQQPTGAG